MDLKKKCAVGGGLVVSALAPLTVLAEESSGLGSVTSGLTTGFGNIASDAMSALGSILPVALPILGAMLVVGIGIKTFKKVSSGREG